MEKLLGVFEVWGSSGGKSNTDRINQNPDQQIIGPIYPNLKYTSY